GSVLKNAWAANRLTSIGDADRDALHAVVTKSRQIPRQLERLALSCCVGGAARELVLARRGAPGNIPLLPGERILRLLDARVAPLAVHAQFHAHDRRVAAPCPAA